MPGEMFNGSKALGDLVFVSRPLTCSMSCMWKQLKAVHSQLILGVHLKWEPHSFSFSGNYFKTKKRLARIKADIKRILGENPRYLMVSGVSLSLPSHDIALRNIWWSIFSDTSEWKDLACIWGGWKGSYLNVHSFHIWTCCKVSQQNFVLTCLAWAFMRFRPQHFAVQARKSLEWSKVKLVGVFLHQKTGFPQTCSLNRGGASIKRILIRNGPQKVQHWES